MPCSGVQCPANLPATGCSLQAHAGAQRQTDRHTKHRHTPWRRNLLFLRPKMRTLEKISTKLPLQSPRFLLGLLRLLLAEGRSQCCSRAWRFCRIKPLAMAAAMAVPLCAPRASCQELQKQALGSAQSRRQPIVGWPKAGNAKSPPLPPPGHHMEQPGFGPSAQQQGAATPVLAAISLALPPLSAHARLSIAGAVAAATGAPAAASSSSGLPPSAAESSIWRARASAPEREP